MLLFAEVEYMYTGTSCNRSIFLISDRHCTPLIRGMLMSMKISVGLND